VIEETLAESAETANRAAIKAGRRPTRLTIRAAPLATATSAYRGRAFSHSSRHLVAGSGSVDYTTIRGLAQFEGLQSHDSFRIADYAPGEPDRQRSGVYCDPLVARQGALIPQDSVACR
jgi:hypothetical protein